MAVPIKYKPLIDQALASLAKQIREPEHQRLIDNMKRKYVAKLFQRGSRWKPGKREYCCLFPGCPNRSISSHTIQAAGALKRVADSVLVGTKWNTADLLDIDSNIGVDRASVFPGFCGEVHDRELFADLEKSDGLQTQQGMLLQIYRVFCRELRRACFDDDYDIAVIEDFRRERAGYFRQLLGRHFPPGFLVDYPELLQNDITDDAAHDREVDALLRRKRDLVISLQAMKLGMDSFICKQNSNPDVFWFYSDINFLLPVTMSGVGDFTSINRVDSTPNRLIFLVVLPLESITRLIFFTNSPHGEYLQSFLRMKNILSESTCLPHAGTNVVLQTEAVLSFVEQFLITSTDHWFLSPNFWNSLPLIVKDAIRTRIRGHDESLSAHWDMPFLPRQ